MENPPPFIIRLYQPTDFIAALSVFQAAALADALPQRATADELRARVSAASTDLPLNPADDLWVASVRAAGVVAYADGWLAGKGGQRGYRTDCFVQPDYRGRGIGRALLTRQWQRAQAIARRLAAAGAPVTVTLGARAWERQAGALAVLESKGMQRARTYLEMQRDLGQSVKPSAAPPTLRLEPWIDRRADGAIWQAYDEAFADHWGYMGESFHSFVRRMTLGHIQGENSLVAWAGRALAGACLNDMGDGDGGGQAWIRHLFVRRVWRGRGLGRALLDASLIHAKQLGYSTAGLMVDAENTTAALKLYRAAGFVDVARRINYQRSYTANFDEGRSVNVGG